MSTRPEPDPLPRHGTRYVGSSDHPLIRPRDAASIMVIDRSGATPRVLVGKRGKAHVFMPDVYVFPGGRRDLADSRIPVAAPFDGAVLAKLTARCGARMTDARARALGVAAIRETYEEASLTIGADGDVGPHPHWRGFAERTVAPDLSRLRYVARAITPPRQSRRYDTRFFACFLDEIAAAAGDVRDSDELHDLTWLGFDDLDSLPLPRITQSILEELRRELAFDPALPFGRPVPFFFVSRGIFVRDVI